MVFASSVKIAKDITFISEVYEAFITTLITLQLFIKVLLTKRVP